MTGTSDADGPDAAGTGEVPRGGAARPTAAPLHAALAPEELPAEFVRFLRANGVSPDAYRGCGPLPRYVRVNPRGPLALRHPTGPERFTAITAALGSVKPVAWLSGPWAEVYECSASTNLSRNDAYRDGSLHGIDAASVFAVCCLEPRPGDAVLDLCCAPGAKLCAACDAVSPGGEVVGVDVSAERLAACRAILRKYGVPNARLAAGDGTAWDPARSEWLDLDPPRGRGQRGRKRRLGERPGAEAPACPALFDRVLVDAECTHDGSVRHLQKFGEQWGWGTLAGRVPWLRREGLEQLQGALLANGFRLLREGGSLVYATCSLCRRQNEDVVAAFLEAEPRARLAPLPISLRPPPAAAGPGEAPARPSLLEEAGPRGPGGRHCTARFDPFVSGTSGLFLARLERAPG